MAVIQHAVTPFPLAQVQKCLGFAFTVGHQYWQSQSIAFDKSRAPLEPGLWILFEYTAVTLEPFSDSCATWCVGIPLLLVWLAAGLHVWPPFSSLILKSRHDVSGGESSQFLVT